MMSWWHRGFKVKIGVCPDMVSIGWNRNRHPPQIRQFMTSLVSVVHTSITLYTTIDAFWHQTHYVNGKSHHRTILPPSFALQHNSYGTERNPESTTRSTKMCCYQLTCNPHAEHSILSPGLLRSSQHSYKQSLAKSFGASSSWTQHCATLLGHWLVLGGKAGDGSVGG